MYEDGNVNSVMLLIDVAKNAKSKERQRRTLKQALNSAKCIENEKTRKELICLIEEVLADLDQE